jgi:hypothetical protein
MLLPAFQVFQRTADGTATWETAMSILDGNVKSHKRSGAI